MFGLNGRVWSKVASGKDGCEEFSGRMADGPGLFKRGSVEGFETSEFGDIGVEKSGDYFVDAAGGEREKVVDVGEVFGRDLSSDFAAVTPCGGVGVVWVGEGH